MQIFERIKLRKVTSILIKFLQTLLHHHIISLLIKIINIFQIKMTKDIYDWWTTWNDFFSCAAHLSIPKWIGNIARKDFIKYVSPLVGRRGTDKILYFRLKLFMSSNLQPIFLSNVKYKIKSNLSILWSRITALWLMKWVGFSNSYYY